MHGTAGGGTSAKSGMLPQRPLRRDDGRQDALRLAHDAARRRILGVERHPEQRIEQRTRLLPGLHVPGLKQGMLRSQSNGQQSDASFYDRPWL